MKLITLSSDFGKQTQGIGQMHGVIHKINPEAKVIDLMHGIPAFDIRYAAWVMESVAFIPPGFHVCVVDPGVGTKRRSIIVKVKRGDYFIGPDNGCLMTAPRILGGVEKIAEVTNEKYMNQPVSPIFHGRDVFSPAAAHLSLGVSIEEFGAGLKEADCAKAPYGEAKAEGGEIEAIVVRVNDFGSITLNILQPEWDKLGVKEGAKVTIGTSKGEIELPYVKTFGSVPRGEALVMKDDYSRIEVAVNQGSFVEKFPLAAGGRLLVRRK